MYVRRAPWHAPVALLHPETGRFVVPGADEFFEDDDPLVLAHGWVFATEEEIDRAIKAAVEVEQVGR